MTMHFTKMHGLGNDFIVIDAIHQSIHLTPGQIRQLADRHLGIGFDQCLLVEPAKRADVDFHYRIFNADGQEVAQCGNGARCLARFVLEKGLSTKKPLVVSTLAGSLALTFTDDGDVTVNMGIPRFQPKNIPLAVDERQDSYALQVNHQTLRFYAVNVGNPHAVILVDALEDIDIDTLGPLVQQAALFPEGVNVGFMQIITPDHIKLRVYERGSGETLACGSGACAAMVIAAEHFQCQTTIKVSLLGGDLSIHWPGNHHPIHMTGPATTVFEGAITIS